MNVADLQQLLADVERLLTTAGVKVNPLKELSAFRESLVPFCDRPLKEITSLLVQADETARGIPITSPGRKRSGGDRTLKKDTPDPAAMASEVRELYERVADPAVTEADVDALMNRLEPMKKDGLLAVASAIELKVVKSKSKEHIINEIRKRILARKRANQRSQMLGEEHREHKSPTGENGDMARPSGEPALEAMDAD